MTNEDKQIVINYLRTIAREAMHGCYTAEKVEWSLFDSIKRSADYALMTLGADDLLQSTKPTDESTDK